MHEQRCPITSNECLYSRLDDVMGVAENRAQVKASKIPTGQREDRSFGTFGRLGMGWMHDRDFLGSWAVQFSEFSIELSGC